MIEMESNHCQIVTESLDGLRSVDEQTFASLGVLSERLERVKQLDPAFAGVSLSPAAKELLSQDHPLPIA